MSRYVSEFLSLKSTGDILNVVNPLGNKAEKEISETMAVKRFLKSIALKAPMKYSVLDLCAGNALTSVLSVFVLPVARAVAVDVRPRKRNWEGAKRFSYSNIDINGDEIFNLVDENTIIIAIHPCSDLANRVIEIYNKTKAKHLILMPCCKGKVTMKLPNLIKSRLGKDMVWTWQLAQQCKGKTEIYEDKSCLSPRNSIIYSHKN